MPRKGENIFKRKDGRWEARYVKGYDLNGKQKYGSIYGKNYLEVKNKRSKLLINYTPPLKKDTYNNQKFIDKIKLWLNQQKISIKITTYSYYLNITQKYIIKYLGKLYVNDITEETVTNFIEQLLTIDGLKISTVREITTVLMQILNFFKRKIKVKLPRVEKNKIQVLSIKEKEKLEKYILNNINYYSIGILISLYTGLRIREICGLKWKDINLSSGIISVSKTLTRVCNLECSTPKTKLLLVEAKTKNSIRQIPINNNLIKLLKQVKGNTSDECFVLTAKEKYIDPRNYYNQYKKILKLCNLEKYNYHSLRHTFATNCTELGLDPKSLSEILGHSDIKITLSLYVHPNLEQKRNFMNTKLNLNI